MADAGRLGVVLAGARFSGRQLAAWVVEALREVAGEVVVTMKEGAAVPAVDGVAVWEEPEEARVRRWWSPRQPLLGVYRGSVAAELRAAVEVGRPARAVAAGLGAASVAVPDPESTLFNVNTLEDLTRAGAMVSGG